MYGTAWFLWWRQVLAHHLHDGLDVIIPGSVQENLNWHFMQMCPWMARFEMKGWDNTHKRCKVFLFDDGTCSTVTQLQCLFWHVHLWHHNLLMHMWFSSLNLQHCKTGHWCVPIQFFHIHGTGIKSVIAHRHRGQALGDFLPPWYLLKVQSSIGLGRFCVELWGNNWQPCKYEPYHHMQDLNSYEHLWWFFCVCVVHFKRNIQPLRHELSWEVIEAMYSLASADAHPDFEATLAIIWNGGLKAIGIQYWSFNQNKH